MQVKCATEFHNDFWQKKLFLFFKNNFTKINHCKFIHHKSHLKPFLSYLPCMVHKEYLSIIFNVKKCTLYQIKYCIFNYFYRVKKSILYRKFSPRFLILTELFLPSIAKFVIFSSHHCVLSLIPPGACTMKLFTALFTDFRDKLECLSLVSLSSLV